MGEADDVFLLNFFSFICSLRFPLAALLLSGAGVAVTVTVATAAAIAVAISVLIAVAPAGRRHTAHVVEHTPEEVGAALLERIRRVVQALGRDAVLPDDQQRQVGKLRQRLRVGKQRHRRRVENNEIHFLTQLHEHRAHPLRGQKLRGVRLRLDGEERIQILRARYST